MTAIVSLAARLSDSPRDAELAVLMERHWREVLLPEVLLGGYKSIEIAQAQLLLSLYHKPTKSLPDDRSWQYLGFAIRTATEVGINRPVSLSSDIRDCEQVRRRIRNRSRTWFNLFLADRLLSSQTGRAHTIGEDAMITEAGLWHREDFAIPEDVSIVALIKLRRLTTQHSEALDAYIKHRGDHGSVDPLEPITLERRLAGLELFRKTANLDLEGWKAAWCVSGDGGDGRDDTASGIQNLAMGDYLVRWRAMAMLWYSHARLYINSIVLQAMEQLHETELAAPVALDCWNSARSLIDVLLDDVTQEELESSPNQTAVMATWAALAALRLTRLDHERHAWVDRQAIMAMAKALADALAAAGRSPAHRNGAAGPYGSYLRRVLKLWESPGLVQGRGRADDAALSSRTTKGSEGNMVAKREVGDGQRVEEPVSSRADASDQPATDAHSAPAKSIEASTDDAAHPPAANLVVDPVLAATALGDTPLVGTNRPISAAATAAGAAAAAASAAAAAATAAPGEGAMGLSTALMADLASAMTGGTAAAPGAAAAASALPLSGLPVQDVWSMAPSDVDPSTLTGAASGGGGGHGGGGGSSGSGGGGLGAAGLSAEQNIDRIWDLGFPVWPQTAWGGMP